MEAPSETKGASSRAAAEQLLACCHGFVVAAGERAVGFVETPLFTRADVFPDYLLVRTTAAVAGTFRVVPVQLVAEIEECERRIRLDADATAVAALPERLPLDRTTAGVA